MGWVEDKQKEYEDNFGDIPKDYNDRINWMIDKYNLSPKQMDSIIEKKRNMEFSMMAYDYKVVIYEIPSIKSRPRYRVINRKNYMDFAANKGGFVHVYSPHAKDYHDSLHELVEEELEALHIFVQTPCTIVLNAYEKTPKSFNITDTFLAEYGLIFNTSQNDYDNILKLTSDRFNANVWLDDKLVVSGTVNKFYSILPREEIFIRYLNCATTPNQYKKIVNMNGYRENYPIDYLDKFGVIQHNEGG